MQVNNSTILHCQSWQRENSNSHTDAASKVSELLQQIQSQGDAAVEAFSQQFDGFS